MPVQETADQREERRSAVKTICRLSTALQSPEKLSRDVGGQILAERVAQLRDALQGEELQILEDTVRQYETAVGRALNFEDAQAGEQSVGAASSMPEEPSQPSASFQVQSQSGGRSFRIHGQDLQLTFNHGPWRSQNENAEEWFASQGVHLVARFQTWALEELPQKFREPILHMSLTLEELNKARGGHVQVSRNRAHFYVYCSKVGTLWSFTNYWPFVDYEVQPFWLMGWWATGKLSNKQYKSYLLKCKKSYRGLLQNFEAVVHSENALQLEEYRETVVQILASARLPFRSHDDPLFPCLPHFLEQFRWARDRCKLYALQGPSQAAKTSFVKSLFKSPFVLTIQGQDVLNLQSFQYGRHDALILDNLVEWSLILKYRALLQANVDLHMLGESATGIYSYSVFLWGVPICVTLDADVDSTPFLASEWLQANVYRDVLPVGAKCYLEGERASGSGPGNATRVCDQAKQTRSDSSRGSTKLKGRTSLAEILEASPVEIAKVLIEKNFCSEAPAAKTCSCQSSKWKLEPRGGACNWRCKVCRKTVALTNVDADLFGGQRLPLKAIAGALWLYSSKLHLSPDDCSLLLGVDHRAIRTLFETFNQHFVPIIDQMNDAIVVGLCSADVELDEISFRSSGRAHGIVWLKYLAVARRGSSLVWLKRLGYRIAAPFLLKRCSAPEPGFELHRVS
ncbi:unnamed protein product [Symbiodinium sp. CCMP2592]|nr:unnamed protein product [Symbiodinium sp. CCMP2592]